MLNAAADPLSSVSPVAVTVIVALSSGFGGPEGETGTVGAVGAADGAAESPLQEDGVKSRRQHQDPSVLLDVHA